MTARPGPISSLVRSLDDLSAARSSRRSCTRWGQADPVLAGYPTAADLAAAIRTAAPSAQDELIGALLGQAGSDELAQLTVVAGLSRRLGS